VVGFGRVPGRTVGRKELHTWAMLITYCTSKGGDITETMRGISHQQTFLLIRGPAKETGTCGKGLIGTERQIEKKFLNEEAPQTSSSVTTVNPKYYSALVLTVMLNNPQSTEQSRRRRWPHCGWGYFDVTRVTTESTASARRNSEYRLTAENKN
jgi:hypothetical protein